MAHGLEFEWCASTWLGGPSAPASFVRAISEQSLAQSETGPWREHGYLIPDPLAVCAAIDPGGVIARQTEHYATVELGGRSRGTLLIDVDHVGKLARAGKRNLAVVRAVAMPKVMALLEASTR